MEQKETLTIKVLSGCIANLNPDNLDITGDKHKYPSTPQKFLTKPEVKVQYIETPVALPNDAANKLDKFSISSQFSQGAALELYRKEIKSLVVLFANAFHPGGHGEIMKAQEENILKDSNASYAIPKNYGEGLILTYDGLYVISDALIKLGEKDIIPVDFAFVAMPDLRRSNDNIELGYVGHENRAAYLRHITSLIILQFYAAKLTGKVMITGRQGCGVFQNNDEDIAAVIHAVATLPEFQEIKVVYALGRDGKDPKNTRHTHAIYSAPLAEKLVEVNRCIELIQNDIGSELNINAVSHDMRERYCKKVKPELMNKRLESTFIVNKVKENLNENVVGPIVEVLPFFGPDKLPRYQCRFKNKEDAESFSRKIFNLGIGAQSNPNNLKFCAEQTDGSYTIVFATGQFDLLKFSVFSESAIDKNAEKFSKVEHDNIKNLVGELETFIRNKRQAGVLEKAPELKNTLNALNALNVLLKLNIKGYPRAIILQYIQAEYPEVIFKLNTFLNSLEKAAFLKEPISKDYELFCPVDVKNPTHSHLELLVKEMNENKRDYAFTPDDVGRQHLREVSRKAHGYSPKDENANIRYIFEGGALAAILAGKNVKITDFNQKPILIEVEKIQQYQKDVEIIRNDKITAQDILRIQNIKSGKANVSGEVEKYALESKGKNFLIRGEADQYFDEKGCALDTPRPRIFYYACFPDLRKGTADFKEFVNNDVIKDKEKYKDSVKDVVRLMLRMAHQHGEAIDIVTPNAFFAGLSEAGQQEAKKLFADAVLELISENDFRTIYGNVPAVILHADGQDQMKKAIEAKSNEINVPVILNAGDASSPQYAAIKQNLPFRVAEALMGDVLGPTGNGALGPRANQAKEENDTRKTVSCLTLVFNAMFNPRIITKIYELDRTLGQAPQEQSYQCSPALTSPHVTKLSASMLAQK